MTQTVIDAFTGANGTDVNPAKWSTEKHDGTGTATILNGKVRLDQPVGYKRLSIQSVATYAGGEVLADVTLVDAVFFFSFGAYSDSPYDAPYTQYPINGYAIDVQRNAGVVRLLKMVNESPTVLGTTAVAAMAAGDVLHMAIRPDPSGVKAWFWRGAAARPASPTFTSTDTTYTSGEVRLGVYAQDPGDGTVDVGGLIHDDLVTAPTGPARTVDVRLGGVLVGARDRYRVGGALEP